MTERSRKGAVVEAKVARSSVQEILQNHGVNARLELINTSGRTTGPLVDISAQDAADAAGLPLRYEENFGRLRTVHPGEPHLESGYHPKRTLSEIWDDLSYSSSLKFQLSFSLGTDYRVAREAVQEIVDNEQVPFVLSIDEEIKPQEPTANT